MARKRSAVRQTDLTRYLRAFKNAGIDVARAEIDTVAGKVVIFSMAAVASQQPVGALDEWMAKNARTA
jgi:hypothetical protein